MGYGERELMRIKYGVCLDCKEADALPGMRRCAKCRERVNRKARVTYHAQKGRSICTRCKKRPSQTGKTRCQSCQSEVAKENYIRYWTKRGKLLPQSSGST